MTKRVDVSQRRQRRSRAGAAAFDGQPSVTQQRDVPTRAAQQIFDQTYRASYGHNSWEQPTFHDEEDAGFLLLVSGLSVCSSPS